MPEFKKISSAESSKLRRENPEKYQEYLIQKQIFFPGRREILVQETFDAIRNKDFLYLLEEEERAIRKNWTDLYREYSSNEREFEKEASREEKEQAKIKLAAREILINGELSKEDAVKEAIQDSIADAKKQVEKAESILRLAIAVEKRPDVEDNSAGIKKAEESLNDKKETLEIIESSALEAKTEDFFSKPLPAEQPPEFFFDISDDGEPCKYEMIDKAEEFLSKILPQMRTSSALDKSASGMSFFEGKGAEGDYFSIQFLLLYLRNLVALYEDQERFKSPSGAIEALAELMAWKKRDDRLKRYRITAKEINSRCYPAIGYIDQIDKLLDEKIESFSEKLFNVYQEQIKIASGEVGSHAAIGLSGEAMAQFEELSLFEESAFFQIRQLEEFDKHFKEIADPSYEGLNLIDGANAAKNLLSHLDELKNKDDRLNNRFVSVPDKSDLFSKRIQDIHLLIDKMNSEFTQRLDEIEKKVRGGYDNGGSDAVVLAEEDVKKEIETLEKNDIEEADAKTLLDAEDASLELFSQERSAIHSQSLEEEIESAREVREDTIRRFNENLEARKVLEIQEAEAQKLLGQKKLDSIANVIISVIDDIFESEASKIIASKISPAESSSSNNQSLGFFDILTSAGTFLIDNADKIAILGSTAIVGFGTVEQLKLQEEIADLNEDISRKQLELQEKVTDAQLRLLDVQADSLQGQSDIEQEILRAQADIIILKADRDKRILGASSEFEILKAQIESQKEKIILREEGEKLDRVELAQEIEKEKRDREIEKLQESLEDISDSDLLDFIDQREVKDAFQEREEFLSSESSDSKVSVVPIAVVLAGIAGLLMFLKGKKDEQGSISRVQ